MSIATEREKLKEMSTKDKIWYIWEYYKFHIIFTVIGLFVLFQVGATIYSSSYNTLLHCIYLNSYNGDINFQPLEEGFGAYIGKDSKDLIVGESAFIALDDEATEYSYASMAKITAMVSAKELDVLIGDTASTDHYSEFGAFCDLEVTLPEDLLTALSDRLYYATDESGTRKAVAIDISNTDFADASLLSQDMPLLGIISNSQHTPCSLELIRYIFQIPAS